MAAYLALLRAVSCVLLMFAPALAAAGQAYATSGFASHHISQEQYCENNTGSGFVTESGLFVVGYTNSLCRPSLAAGREWRLMESRLHPVAGVGLSSGYWRTITPVAYVGAGLDVRGLVTVLGFTPKAKQSPAVIWFQLRWAIAD